MPVAFMRQQCVEKREPCSSHGCYREKERERERERERRGEVKNKHTNKHTGKLIYWVALSATNNGYKDKICIKYLYWKHSDVPSPKWSSSAKHFHWLSAQNQCAAYGRYIGIYIFFPFFFKSLKMADWWFVSCFPCHRMYISFLK